MELRICETIKRLRKERGITQEKLAVYLNISPQAVSKWEKGQAYPDITMVPALANLFGISVDALFNMNGERNEQRIDGILTRSQELNAKGLMDENIKMLKDALAEFPGEYRLMDALSTMEFCLYGAKGDKDLLSGIKEREELILQDCPDDELRYKAIQLLVYCLKDLGDKDRALTIANKLPSYLTREMVVVSILEGERKIVALQELIYTSFGDLQFHLAQLAFHTGRSGDKEKAIRIMALMDNLYALVIGKSAPDMASSRMGFHFDYAETLLETGRTEEAMGSLKSGVNLIDFIHIDQSPSKNILFDGVDKGKWKPGKNYPETEAELALKWTMKKAYDSLRDSPEFKGIVEGLHEKANRG